MLKYLKSSLLLIILSSFHLISYASEDNKEQRNLPKVLVPADASEYKPNSNYNLPPILDEDSFNNHKFIEVPSHIDRISNTSLATKPYEPLNDNELEYIIKNYGLKRLISLELINDRSEINLIGSTNNIIWEGGISITKSNKDYGEQTFFSKEKADHLLHKLGTFNAQVRAQYLNYSGDISFNNTNENRVVQQTGKIHLLAKYVVPKVDIHVETIKLSDTFLVNLGKAVNSNNRNQLIDFFRRNGFYVPTRFTLGGVIYIEDTRQNDENKSEESYKQEIALALKASFGAASASVGGGHGSNTNQGEKSFKETSLFNKHIMGGDIQRMNSLYDWISSVDNYNLWNVIERSELKPVYDFCSEDLKHRCLNLMTEEVKPIHPPTSDEKLGINHKNFTQKREGYAPVTITIKNNSRLNLTLAGYDIIYGKIYEPEQAELVNAGEEKKFFAYGGKMLNYRGTRGEAFYHCKLGNHVFQFVFGWASHFLGDPVQGRSESTHPYITIKTFPITKKDMSELIFELEQSE